MSVKLTLLLHEGGAFDTASACEDALSRPSKPCLAGPKRHTGGLRLLLRHLALTQGPFLVKMGRLWCHGPAKRPEPTISAGLLDFRFHMGRRPSELSGLERGKSQHRWGLGMVEAPPEAAIALTWGPGAFKCLKVLSHNSGASHTPC